MRVGQTSKIESSFEAGWDELKKSIQDKWEEFTDADLSEMRGSRETLIDKLMDRYDLSEEEARREVDRIWIE